MSVYELRMLNFFFFNYKCMSKTKKMTIENYFVPDTAIPRSGFSATIMSIKHHLPSTSQKKVESTLSERKIIETGKVSF